MEPTHAGEDERADLPRPREGALASLALGTAPTEQILRDALQTIRDHLSMDAAFVSEFLDGRRYFRYIDIATSVTMLAVGRSDPLDETYCQYVVDGRLPQLIPDTSVIPLAMSLSVTAELPIGAHLSVPILFSDGSVYGTFCCFKHMPDPTLHARDLSVMRMFAEFAGKQLERQVALQRTHAEMAERVQSVIDKQSFSIVYQPIYHFGEDRIVGFEALARFSATPIRPPNIWFDEAAQVGLVEELEMVVMKRALDGLALLPADTYLSLNVSPDTVLSGMITQALDRAPLDRIVLELTEHVSIPDYALLSRVLSGLRGQGLHLAVDDAGAGYASFRHILLLDPDIIKLDISLTRDIDTDRTRRALAAALIRFAEETGIRIIAEGVETEAELAILRHLRTNKAQGYLIGRPMPLPSAIALLSSRLRMGH